MGILNFFASLRRLNYHGEYQHEVKLVTYFISLIFFTKTFFNHYRLIDGLFSNRWPIISRFFLVAIQILLNLDLCFTFVTQLFIRGKEK